MPDMPSLTTPPADAPAQVDIRRDPLVIPIITSKDIPAKLFVETPGAHAPDVNLVKVAPLLALIAAAGKTFCTNFVVFWTATPVVAHIAGATTLPDIYTAAKIAGTLALIPTITEAVTTLGLLFTKLAQKYPVLGS